MTLTDRQYLYDVISLDLGTTRTDLAQGLTKKINSITILDLGGGTLSFKLNASSNDSITASDGLKIDGIPVTEIYWTNVLQAGVTAIIFIVWVD